MGTDVDTSQKPHRRTSRGEPKWASPQLGDEAPAAEDEITKQNSDIIVEVAVPTPVRQTFSYYAPTPLEPGTRVQVPFGKRSLLGVVLGATHRAAVPQGVTLRPIISVVDTSPIYSGTMLDLGRWIANYYFYPLGEVLRAMLPASHAKVVAETYVLTEAGLAARAQPGSFIAELFQRGPTLTAPSLKRRLRLVATGSASWRDGAPSLAPPTTLDQLVGTGLVERRAKTSRMRARVKTATTRAKIPAEEPSATNAPPLTPQQSTAAQTIITDGLTGTDGKVFLLHGVTGSGKTEVYLKLISHLRQTQAGSGQTLVLVPEISLTPQMTRVFTQRFPEHVAVVHSAMADPERWAELMRIHRGEATILIGPRSAVFAPFQNLRLIVVDEEHDGSYKQSSGLSYHGRDVAVLRGKLEGITVLLGSATPSMESWQNAQSGRYRLISLPERVTGRPLPRVDLVPMAGNPRQGTLLKEAVTAPEAAIPIHPHIVDALRETISAGQQAIVLVNRRGYSYYLYSLADKKPVQCPHCSISLTPHAKGNVLRCHYCDYRVNTAAIVGTAPSGTYATIGYGSQKAEDALAVLLPAARLARLDSDVVRDRDILPQTLGRFRDGSLDLLVGTQILAKGHDFPNVTLIVLLEVDQLLGLPDFRAGERTFQLLVQAAGRAGRAQFPGRVLMQTMRAGHPIVEAARHQDFAAFAAEELAFRARHGYPPFTRLIALEINGTDRAALGRLTRRIENWLDQLAAVRPELMQQVRILGPSAPPIETVRGRHRQSLILSGKDVTPLRTVAQQFLDNITPLPGDMRLLIDVDPQSLM